MGKLPGLRFDILNSVFLLIVQCRNYDVMGLFVAIFTVSVFILSALAIGVIVESRRIKGSRVASIGGLVCM